MSNEYSFDMIINKNQILDDDKSHTLEHMKNHLN